MLENILTGSLVIGIFAVSAIGLTLLGIAMEKIKV